MRLTRIPLITSLVVALAASWIVPASGNPGGAEASLPVTFDRDLLSSVASGRAIVGFRHDVDVATIRRLTAAGITQAVRLDTIDAVGVLGPAAAYRAIAGWADVAYVDADLPIRFDNYASKKDTKVTSVREGKAPLKTAYDGTGVTVAVIDTGIDTTHPDLADQVVKHVNFEPAWFMDMIYDGVYSDQLTEATGSPLDTYGHGTHVAGIVAGTGESSMVEDYSGVAPGASLVNLKIADAWEGVDCTVPCDFGWEINALVAFEWLIEHRHDPQFPGGIRVATNSWGIYEVDSGAEPIVLITKEAVRSGISVLFSAGNSGPDENTVGPGPETLPEVITVAAACKSVDSCGAGEMADFSSRGPQVDVAAPGDNIFSTRPSIGLDGWALGKPFEPIFGPFPPPPGEDDLPAAMNNFFWYVALSGTSMSCPHVAGIVALILDANPKLTPNQVQDILHRTATDRGKKGFDTTWGYGLADAHKAVALALKTRGKARPTLPPVMIVER